MTAEAVDNNNEQCAPSAKPSKNLLSDAQSWSLTDPATEDIARSINKIVLDNFEGYSTMKSLRMLTGGAKTIVTQMVKRSRDEVMCGGASILKTLVTQIVDINTK